MLKWIADIFTKNPRPRPRPQSRFTFRPFLERLEDRELLSGGPTAPDAIVKPPKPEPVPAITRELPPSGITPATGKRGLPESAPAVAQVLPPGSSGPDAGGGNPAVWKPAGVNNLASNPANWTTGQVPTNGIPAVFDGSISNAPIIWDTPPAPSSEWTPGGITLKNKYTGQMTLNTGVVVASTAGISEDANSQFDVDFKAPSCTLAVQGGTSNLMKFDFTDQKGLFEIEGGTVTIQSNTSNGSTASIDVFQGTTLKIVANTGVMLNGGAVLTVYQGGTLNLDGTLAGFITPLKTDGTAGSILNNMGTVNFTGVPGNSTSLYIPVLNSGTFNASGGGSAQQAGAQLGLYNTDAATANSDFDMTGGSLNLSGAVTFFPNHTYTQTGGTLQTTDSLPETLKVGGTYNGTAAISGGNIKMGTPTTYGELDVYCGALNMSGEYDPKINGQATGKNDQLVLKHGFMSIQNGSTIKVTVVGGLAAGKWPVISGSTEPLSDFSNKSLGGTDVNPIELENGIYELDAT